MKHLFRGIPPLYLISDTSISNLTHREICRKALANGVKVIQIREKSMSKRELFKEAMYIRRLTQRHNAIFIINDYVDIAYLVDADGVHLGQDDLPLRETRRVIGKDRFIGISTHTLKQAIEAEKEGADYIGFGPLFYTDTKEAGQPKGINSLKKVRRHVDIPVVAIGGITMRNFKEVLDAGADAVAMISGILKGDIEANIKGFLTELRQFQKSRINYQEAR
jgi:thiamine-phosphate diphosphorylase